jgi:choline dehydrogenase-like flavoprotein
MAMKSVPSTQVPKTEEFDLVVLGSGTGSKVAAWTTAEQGKRVALIERKTLIIERKTLIEGLNFLFASVPSESNQAMQTDDRGRDTDERLKKLA